jgi:5-methylcytosine-specific restriction endonuclease McrA
VSRFVVGATEFAGFRIPDRRRCIACEEEKDSGDFYLKKYTTQQGKQSYRLDSTCRACTSQTRKAGYRLVRAENLARCARYRAANRSQLNARLSDYRRRNLEKTRRQRADSEQRRRARGYNACVKSVRGLTAEVLESYRIGDRYLDAYTGDLVDKPTIDHVIPLSRGGAHAIENLCVTSRANNTSKHDTPLLIWLLQRRGVLCRALS